MSILQNPDSTIETTDESNNVDVNKEEISDEKILEHSTSSNAKQKLLDLSHVHLFKKYVDDEISIINFNFYKNRVPEEVKDTFLRYFEKPEIVTDTIFIDSPFKKFLYAPIFNNRLLVNYFQTNGYNAFFSDSDIISTFESYPYQFIEIHGDEYSLSLNPVNIRNMNIDSKKLGKLFHLLYEYYEYSISVKAGYRLMIVNINDEFNIENSYVYSDYLGSSSINSKRDSLFTMYYDYTNCKGKYELLRRYGHGTFAIPSNSHDAVWTFFNLKLPQKKGDRNKDNRELLRKKIIERKQTYEKKIEEILNG